MLRHERAGKKSSLPLALVASHGVAINENPLESTWKTSREPEAPRDKETISS
jgi:hypothetical protein